MDTKKRTKEDIHKEMKCVGGSLVHIKKNSNEKWEYVKNSKLNRRIDGMTKIPFSNGDKVKGKDHAIGTLANCAGGVTPWGTVLTCEENYYIFYGEEDYKTKKISESMFGWEKTYNYHPHFYGWVVEIDPLTGKAQKHTGMGRFAHESATVNVAKDGRAVVYSGDDKANEFIYKFIADKKGSLASGKLYVADTKNGKWLSLNYDEDKRLQKEFKNQLDVCIHARIAGRIVGATPQDRPEDIEIDKETNNVFVACTNNAGKMNFHGQILKIEEKNGDPLSLEFKASNFAVGGSDSGFSCPDNMVFDKAGNMWMTSDISGSRMNKFPYTDFKNNGLFYIPLRGKGAGVAHQVASAPTDAEFTGVSFSDDGKTLFVSVQHPGEKSKSLDKLTSHWPDGGDALPRPAVVQISGPLFDDLMHSGKKNI